MCKKIICAVLSLVLLLSLVPASAIPAAAAENKCGENLTWHYKDGVLTIVGSGDMDDYTSVSKTPWASYLNDIIRVTFLGGPFQLGKNSFPDGSYPKLEGIVVSDLAAWSTSVFQGQNPLKLGTRPNLYTCDAEGNGWDKVENLVLPAGTGYVNAGAFSGGSFRSVSIPSSVNHLDSNAFLNCRNLRELKIEEGLERIGFGAFAGTNLENVTLPSSVASMGDSVFAGCPNLKSVTFGSGLKALGNLTFANCPLLTEVNLPDTLETIGGGTFSGCVSLKNITLPNTLQNIPTQTFAGCTSLTRIDVPASVSYIAADSFDGSSLEAIHTADLAAWCNITFDGGNPLQKCAKLYEGEKLIKDLVIPESVTEISPYAFAGACYIESVGIPDFLTRIGENAFLDCVGITDVYVARKEQWDDLKKKALPGNETLFDSSVNVHYSYPESPSLPGNDDFYDPNESINVSEEIVEMVMAMIPFHGDAYNIGGKWVIGYGTPANSGDKISQAEAKNILRSYLNMAAYKIFVQYESYLSGKQIEALSAFTVLNNHYWIGGGELHTAIVDPGSQDFLEAIMDTTSYADRRASSMALAALFLDPSNNYYPTAPSNYAYVVLDPNGGNSSPSGNIQGYVTTETTPILDKYTPNRMGYEFVGWYSASEGGNLVTTLDSSTNTMTLYAHWQAHDEGVDGESIVGKPVSYRVPAMVAVWGGLDSTGRISVFRNPKETSIVNTLDTDAIVQISHEYRDPITNDLWLKVQDSGWLYLGVGSSFAVEPGVVTLKPAQRLDVHEAPGVDQPVIPGGSLRNGDAVAVFERTTVNGTPWGVTVFLNQQGYNTQYEAGWIDLTYVNFNGTINGGDDKGPEQKPADPDSPTGNPPISTGVIVNCDRLNVRGEPNVYGQFYCKLNRGTKVDIYEKTETNGVAWALLNEGWACMQYIQEDAPAKPEKPQKPSNPGEVGTDDNTVALAKGQVVPGVILNVRKGPGPQFKEKGKLSSGARFSIFQTKMYNGAQWGRMEDGWVCMTYVLLDGDIVIKGEDKPAEEAKPTTLGQGRVVNCSTHVNVRASASAGSALQGTFPLGNIIDLLEETQNNGFTWYRTTKGWVCGDYVQKMAAPKPVPPVKPDTPSVPGTPSAVQTGTVSANVDVNVREAPGVENRLVTTLRSGSKVNIYESQDVNGVTWYRIDQGWMSGEYIILGTGAGNSMGGGLEGSAGTTETAKGQYATATVAQAGLKAHAGAGYGYKDTATLALGKNVTIYEQRLVDGVAWGRISNTEWINMAYITLHSTGITGTGTVGTIIRAGHAVNVRNTPSADGARMATILVGAPVEVLEVKDTGNGESWGRTPQGWINMYYISVAEIPAPPIPDPVEPAPTTPAEPSKPEKPKPVDQGVPFNMAGYIEIAGESTPLRMIPGVLGDYDAEIANNAEVQIIKIDKVDNKLWGLVQGGWVDMNAVRMKDFVVSNAAQLVYQDASTIKTVGALNKGELVKIKNLEMDAAKKVWGQIDGHAKWADMWIELTAITPAEQYDKSFMVKATIKNADQSVYTTPSAEAAVVETLAQNAPVNIIGMQRDIQGNVWYNMGRGWLPADTITLADKSQVTAKTLVVWADPDMKAAGGVKNQGENIVVTSITLNAFGTPMGKISDTEWVELSGIASIG